MTRATSSGEVTPSLRPTRSTDRVRIWLILIHEGLGSCVGPNSGVRGNPARWGLTRQRRRICYAVPPLPPPRRARGDVVMRGISRTSRMVRWCARTSACRVVGAPERRLARMPSTDTWAAAARGVLLRGKIRNGPILIFPFRTTPHGSLQRAGLRRESGRPVPFDLHGRPKRHEPRSKDRESPRHLVTVLGDIDDVKGTAVCRQHHLRDRASPRCRAVDPRHPLPRVAGGAVHRGSCARLKRRRDRHSPQPTTSSLFTAYLLEGTMAAWPY